MMKRLLSDPMTLGFKRALGDLSREWTMERPRPHSYLCKIVLSFFTAPGA